jgi:hypothetical protein
MSEQEQGSQAPPTVPEVLLSSVHLLVTLAVQAIAARELDDARLAIDGVAAQLPLLERILPAEAMTSYRQALADLQLAYAEALNAPAAEPEAGPGGAEESPVDTPPRPRIWTPGGDV